MENIPKLQATSDKLQALIWWVGAPLFIFFATGFPYWAWNFSAGAQTLSSILRVPVMPVGVFDTYIYLQYIGLAIGGTGYAGEFSWFIWPLRALIHVLPSSVSVSEAWLVSRWITTLLALWWGAWSVRRLTGAGTGLARWLSLYFWLSFILVIGMRPGVFSWYLPFGFVGLVMMAAAAKALARGGFLPALAWAVFALLILWVYPWFLIFGSVWAGSLFAAHLVRTRWRGELLAAHCLGVLTVCGYALLLALGKVTFHVPISWYAFERNGINFSHMPLFSNTVLAGALWIWLLGWKHRQASDAGRRRIEVIVWAWLAMLAAWLSAPLVGVHIHNDHYVAIAVMLAWVSAAFFFLPSAPAGPQASVRVRRLLFGTAVCASLFFFYILQQPLRHHLAFFETYDIHLSVWLALALAAWFAWFSARGMSLEFWWRRARWPLLGVTLGIGCLSLFAVYQRGQLEMPDVLAREAAIAWIRQHVPNHQAVCADPVDANIYATEDERLTFPADANISLDETDDAQHRRLAVIGGAYDAVAAKQDDRFRTLSNGLRPEACQQFAASARLFERLGFSHQAVNAFIGCQEERIAAYEAEVMRAIRAHRVDAAAFRAVCPWVVIPDDQKAFWHLPSGYAETRIDAHTSVWNAR